jgi:hypothetical protein
MQVPLPPSIETACKKFIASYDNTSGDTFSQKLSHKTLVEEEEESTKEAAARILSAL